GEATSNEKYYILTSKSQAIKDGLSQLAQEPEADVYSVMSVCNEDCKGILAGFQEVIDSGKVVYNNKNYRWEVKAEDLKPVFTNDYASFLSFPYRIKDAGWMSTLVVSDEVYEKVLPEYNRIREMYH
nr:hypothetical protein [Eubacterium sp.]